MDYYSSNYRNYTAQNPALKLDHYISEIERMNSKDDMSVLDVGFGLGAFLKHAAAKRPHWSLYGSEIRQEAVDVVATELGEKARIKQGSAEIRLFQGQEFDVITAWDVLEHLPDPRSVMNEMHGWLAKDGILVFVVPVYDGILGPAVRALDKDPTHIHQVSRKFWIETAQSLYTKVNWHGIARYLLPSGRYIHIPTKSVRQFAPAILVTCRR